LKADVFKVTPTLQFNLNFLRGVRDVQRKAQRRAQLANRRARHDSGGGIVLNDNRVQSPAQANAKRAGKRGKIPANGSWTAQQQSQRAKSKNGGQSSNQKGGKPAAPKRAKSRRPGKETAL
jgi:hypothetical protein